MILCGVDFSTQNVDAALERFWANFGTGEPLDPPPPFVEHGDAADLFGVLPSEEIRAYTERLVRGASAERDGIDDLIQKTSHHWRMDRMALVDRNLLRMSVFEIVHLADDVPRNVVINEAVEIAKTFGSAESGAFVNGILDRVGRSANPAEPGRSPKNQAET
ncbi:MAG: transcription antitermination factor NusB [Deltaproteobacteria bacterium]|nr:transcription antitermination factor NusB [Deltaproteobacteria bacterium]